jgi:hypothetical protein
MSDGSSLTRRLVDELWLDDDDEFTLSAAVVIHFQQRNMVVLSRGIYTCIETEQEDMTECIKIIWLMILLMAQSTFMGGSHVFDYIS